MPLTQSDDAAETVVSECVAEAEARILVNVSPGETRAARLEDGVVREIHVQRDRDDSVVGSVYVGRVQRVLAGMDAAFVDIGLERAAFLPVYAMPSVEDGDDHPPRIEQRLTAGHRLLVQVVKDPLGQKGARITSDLTIPSRLLVHKPFSPGVNIAARIEDEAERERLTDIVTALHADSGLEGGIIVRTAADGVTAEELAADMRFLEAAWRDISAKAAKASPETLIHCDLPLSIRMLRDLLAPNTVEVVIDDGPTYTLMQDFIQQFAPEFTGRVRQHEAPVPLFDQYGVDEVIERALQPCVPLKSGGSLVIAQTESMVTIDVNTGSCVGRHSLEQTVLRTNIEAAEAIAHELRLRNLGGIIVIDFIDMIDENHQAKVLLALSEALGHDTVKTSVGGMSPLGLVEVTRKRTRKSLTHQLCAPCKSCQGRGHVKTAETVCLELFREIRRRAGQTAHTKLLVMAAAESIDLLLDELSGEFRQICSETGMQVELQVESLCGPEQFDLVVL